MAQNDDWKWWNDVHGWKEGDKGWRYWMILSPGYLGPNALPVPELKRGYIPESGGIKASLSRHFHPGDPTQDLSFHFLLPACESKIAFEVFGVAGESYGYTEEIRNERFSRDEDGRGLVQGDFYFGSLVQLSKNRRFPNTLLRMACKTASGHAYAARFTDTPGYFMDVSSSVDFEISRFSTIRPYMTLGFYSWQTYNEATPQNDALFYGAGMEYLYGDWRFAGDLAGYSGYLRQRDKPRVITLETRYDWRNTAACIQFLYGLRDWEYKTFRFSFIWKFQGLD